MDDLKKQIDTELSIIEMSDSLKNKIRTESARKRSCRNRIWKAIAVCAVAVVLGGTTVFAAYHFIVNRMDVNGTPLPELDAIHIVHTNQLEDTPDEYGLIRKECKDYDTIKSQLGIHLLDSKLSANNPYMQVGIDTDNKDYAVITINNFILGDTDNYQYVANENRYAYDHGEVFYSPISLTVDLTLSQEQMEYGWESSYLGYYQYVESYISAQGYKVNVIADTVDGNASVEGYQSEKCAVFVADGIMYTLKGKVPLDTLKAVVDTMK